MKLQAVQSMSWLLYVSMAVMIGTMCSMCCCADKMREFPSNYIILGIITSC